LCLDRKDIFYISPRSLFNDREGLN